MTDIEIKKAIITLIDYRDKQKKCDGCLLSFQKENVRGCLLRTLSDCEHKSDIPDDANSHPINHPIDNPITHPAHYTDGNIEVWDFIEDWDLGYFLGNAVKYISRAGKKSKDTRIEDLEKAKCYINKQLAIWRVMEVIPEKDRGEIGPYVYGYEKSLTKLLSTAVGLLCYVNTGSFKRRHNLLDKVLNIIDTQIREWMDEDRCIVET